jgi:hypothetical protein
MLIKIRSAAILILLPFIWVRFVTAQTEVLGGCSAGFDDGTHVVIKTVANQALPRGPAGYLPFGHGFQSGNQKIHRFFFDDQNGLYFGYDMEYEKLEETGKYRVSLSPLSLNPSELPSLTKMRTFTSTAVPSFPPPQIIDDQDTIAFDILINLKTQHKITEQITISSSEIPYNVTTSDKWPRDFGLEDVKLTASNPVLLIDGKAVFNHKGMIGSKMLWFFVPQKGRLLLSIMPHEGNGFNRAGVIAGNQLSVELDGRKYELRSEVPILDASGTWNLYMLIQPWYRIATYGEAGFAIGATAQIE